MSQKEALQDKIARLESDLDASRRQLDSLNAIDKAHGLNLPTRSDRDQHGLNQDQDQDHASHLSSMLRTSLHSLLVITDSALPLGSFAFSSGLESLLMHQPKLPKQNALRHFLLNSLASVSRLAVPYMLKAHRVPSELLEIDNDFDASTPCTVARRASIAQGRALVANWERALRASAEPSLAATALAQLSKGLRLPTNGPFEVCAHLPPVFGVVAAALKLDEYLSAYAFLLNHVKAVLSAAIRAGVLGPFQSQAVLSSDWLKTELDTHAGAARHITTDDAGQVWVPGDLWLGRHELLYSRIFNS